MTPSGGSEADEAATSERTNPSGEAEDAGAEQAEREPAGAQAKGEASAAAGGGTAVKERAPSGNGGRVKASPVARRMARELGVELARLEGSGPGGRIVKADVQAAAESGAPAPDDGAERGEAAQAAPAEAPQRAPEPQRGEAGPKGEAEIQELTRLQQTVSRRMAESKATAPDFSISLTVDMTLAVELRDPPQGGLRPGALVQRHGRQGRGHGAARAPARQRRLPRRQVGALRRG